MEGVYLTSMFIGSPTEMELLETQSCKFKDNLDFKMSKCGISLSVVAYKMALLHVVWLHHLPKKTSREMGHVLSQAQTRLVEVVVYDQNASL